MGLHPDDPRAIEVERLTADAEVLEAEAEQLAALVRGKRAEAAKLRSRAERIEAGTSVTARPVSALAAVRDDGLLAAAGLATEDLPAGFTARDLAGQLEIADVRRAERLLLGLEELGVVARIGGGWLSIDPDEMAVRDYIVEAKEFSMGDAIMALGLAEPELDAHLRRFERRGVVEATGGGFWRYVTIGPERVNTRRRRVAPPESTVADMAPKRGEEVPHTRRIGTTGKPGADKKKAEQGWKVKRGRQGT